MIAVIAGTGTLPIEACKQLLAQSKPFLVVALFPDDNETQLRSIVKDDIEIISRSCYKPNEVLTLLSTKGVTQALLIGKVDKRHLLKKIKIDWLGIKLLASLAYKTDKQVMETVLAELARHNIQVIRQDDVLAGLLVPTGILTGSLTQALHNDIALGMQTALAIAHADIGQTVVVKDGMVLAVEAIEGTDQCIKRGIELGKTDIVICKTARTDQNRKFDLPTLGPASLASLQPGQVRVIAWNSSVTFIAQKDEFIKLAQLLGITLISV